MIGFQRRAPERIYGAILVLIGCALVAATWPAVAEPRRGAGLPLCVKPTGDVTTYPAGSPVKQCQVPAGVSRMKVEAWGAQGGINRTPAGRRDIYGGAGGYAGAVGFVEPRSFLSYFGGQMGGNVGITATKGAGGGGASAVYYGTTAPTSLNDVFVVAGGGGGGACDDGGRGGGVPPVDSRGFGQAGFDAMCNSQQGGGGGGEGHGADHGRVNGGADGFFGNGGDGTSDGFTAAPFGGWGGGVASGGQGQVVEGTNSTGGGGGGGYGGGSGGHPGGGGGGGSYPPSSGTPNFENGVVAMRAIVANPETDACAIEGTSGEDRLLGTPRPETICGFGGDDVILGDEGDDTVRGGPGDDVLRGGRGDDRLDGGPGRDACPDNGRRTSRRGCE